MCYREAGNAYPSGAPEFAPEVKPGSTNVNICVETSWKLFNQHGDTIITNTIKSSRGQSSYLKLFLSSTVYIFSSDNGDTIITN